MNSVKAVLVALSICGIAQAQESAEKPEPPTVKLGKIPEIALAPRPPLEKERIAKIRAYIAKLADIERPDIGLSTTMSGHAFLPLPDQRQFGAGLLTNHHLSSSDALKALVEMGPDSLPYLLEALSDKTPTKFRVDHRGGFGGMWYGDEFWGNPVNPREAKILEPLRRNRFPGEEPHLDSYVVKVGDVCFVAIGQIVGRHYQTVRYQPTACIVINSPTERAKLREWVLAAWKSNDPARCLFESLLADYSTEGIYGGKGMDGWGVGSNAQVAAAMRLLFYFPKETAPLIAARLKKLRIERTGPSNGSYHNPQELETWMKRELDNGVRTDEFVKAVAWSPEPIVREAVQSIFQQTEDVDILAASAQAVTNPEQVRSRLEAALSKRPEDAYVILPALARFGGENAKETFAKMLVNSEPDKCISICQTLYSASPSWLSAALEPLLDDKRASRKKYQINPNNPDSSTAALRVCDYAAEALRDRRSDMRFTLAGEYPELDRQIEAMKTVLRQKP